MGGQADEVPHVRNLKPGPGLLAGQDTGAGNPESGEGTGGRGETSPRHQAAYHRTLCQSSGSGGGGLMSVGVKTGERV